MEMHLRKCLKKFGDIYSNVFNVYITCVRPSFSPSSFFRNFFEIPLELMSNMHLVHFSNFFKDKDYFYFNHFNPN